MLKVLILSVLLVLIAFLGLSVKLILNKKAEFRAGSCGAIPAELKDKGMSCGCGGDCNPEK